MKFSIMGYNQIEAVKLRDTVTEKGKEKRVRIDATDLLILRYFTEFYPNMKKEIIDGKEYGWIKRSKVIEDLPILSISEDAVSERLKKLVHFKLLDYKIVKNNEGTRCYYTHGESYPHLIEDFSTAGESYPQPTEEFSTEKGGYPQNIRDFSTADRVNPVRGTGSNRHGVPGQPGYKDKILKNNIYKGFEKKNSDSLQNSRCECGGQISKNTQIGIYQCFSCNKKYPINQRQADIIARMEGI